MVEGSPRRLVEKEELIMVETLSSSGRFSTLLLKAIIVKIKVRKLMMDIWRITMCTELSVIWR